MTPLENLISEMIVESGPMSIENYMRLAILNTVHGY